MFSPFPLLSWSVETPLSKPRQFALLAVRINLFVLNKPGLFSVMVNLDRATIREHVIGCANLPPGFHHPQQKVDGVVHIVRRVNDVLIPGYAVRRVYIGLKTLQRLGFGRGFHPG